MKTSEGKRPFDTLRAQFNTNTRRPFQIHFRDAFSGTFVLMTNQPGERGTEAEERRKGHTID